MLVLTADPGLKAAAPAEFVPVVLAYPPLEKGADFFDTQIAVSP